MIYRTRDAAKVNGWHLREFGEPADFSEYLENDMNVCLAAGEGCAMFVWRGPGIYEVHCCFEQRGREVIGASKSILATMARDHGARLVWAAIPTASRKVKLYVRWLGFKPAGQATFPHGECEIFTWETGECLHW